jgi:hypothetical protein
VNGLRVEADAKGIGGSTVLWAFEDDGEFLEGTPQEHTFSRPGRHTVRLRILKNGRLAEFSGRLGVSREHELVPPLTAVPKLSVSTVEGSGADLRVTVVGGVETPGGGPPITAIWKISTEVEVHRGTSAEFKELKPGSYILTFTALRLLKARIYGNQRHGPEEVFTLDGLSIATNRVFNAATGAEETETPNDLAAHLFDAGPILPVDTWTVELSLEDNPFLRSVTQSDVEEIDVSEIADAVLSLEYEIAAT